MTYLLERFCKILEDNNPQETEDVIDLLLIYF